MPKVRKNKEDKKLTGFLLYIIELSGREVANYENRFVTSNEKHNAQSSWSKMTAGQREAFNERAKTHIRIKEVEVDEKKKIEEERNVRQQEIHQMLVGELDSKVFYFLSGSYFYEDNSQILPAEIAIAKFSLKDGIIDTMQMEINPGELPVGTEYVTKYIADSSHKYPLPPNCFGESSYQAILMKIKEFIPEGENFPIFFTEGVNTPAETKVLMDNQRIFKHIFQSAQDETSDVKVYSIIELLFCLKQITTQLEDDQNLGSDEKPFENFAAANVAFKLTDEEFKYSSDACLYHQRNNATPFCCLNKCLRFGYIISKLCAVGLKYKLKPGCHFPKKNITANQ